MALAEPTTAAPAESPLLDGNWRLLYTSTKGGSAGKLGPFVGQVTQVMDYKGLSYFNVVKLPLLSATLDAHWDVKDPSTWKVIFDRLTIRIFGKRVISKPFPETATGILGTIYGYACC